MTSAAFKTWSKRLDEPVWPKSWIQQWCNAVVPLSYGERQGGHKTNLTEGEAADLVVMAQGLTKTLEPVHTNQGLRWLRQMGVKRLGFPHEMADEFIRFEWCMAVEERGNRYRAEYTPRWEVVTTNGRYYYFSIPWVSGGGAEWGQLQKVH